MPPPASRLLPPVLAALLVALGPVYARAADVVHVVGKGQTLGAIARRYRVPLSALREANGLKPWQQIHPGLSLVIPATTGPQGAANAVASSTRGAGGAGDAKGKGEPTSKGKAGPKPDPRIKSGKSGSARKDDADAKAEALAHAPRRPGFVHLVRGSEKLDAQLLTRRGKLVPAALPGLSQVLRYYPTNEKTPIDPRLATLIGMVSDHFGGRTLHVVSGFRPYSPVQYTAHSNHNLGRAMDFSVEGVPNTVLRDFCQTFRNAGVGYYPNGSFVHLDVRSVKTTWVDYSRSGEAPRYTPGATPVAGDDHGGDGEPHAGADGSSTARDSDTGSSETQAAPAEVPDSKSGN